MWELKQYVKLLDSIKNMGKYDTMCIVFMGNHGDPFRPYRTLTAYYFPLLMIKLPKASGEIKKFSIPFTLTDISHLLQIIKDTPEQVDEFLSSLPDVRIQYINNKDGDDYYRKVIGKNPETLAIERFPDTEIPEAVL